MDLYELAVAKALSGSGGGGDPVIEALSVTENGTYTAPSGVDGYSPVTVNVSGGGGGGLEFETGTYVKGGATAGIPTVINFTNSHTKPPAIIILASINETDVSYDYIETWQYIDYWQLMNGSIMDHGSVMGYSHIICTKGASSKTRTVSDLYLTSHNSEDTSDTDTSYPRYFAKNDSFYPYAGESVKYGKTLPYKWIAIWV